MTDAPLKASYQAAKRMTALHARSFYLCSFVLPREKRRGAYALYALCRYVDDMVDAAGPDREAIRETLGAVGSLEGALDRWCAGRVEPGDPPFAAAFAETTRRYGIRRALFSELLEGVRMDLDTVDIPNWDALRNYCYHVASVVGLMMCPILGLRDSAGEAHAVDLGIAMQLTNIIRDVGEDWRLGRVYLPAEDRLRFGVTDRDLQGTACSPALKMLLRHQVERAREYYARGEEGLHLLPTDGSRRAARLMSRIYGAILTEVERMNYEVLAHRASTSGLTKLKLALSHWGD